MRKLLCLLFLVCLASCTQTRKDRYDPYAPYQAPYSGPDLEPGQVVAQVEEQVVVARIGGVIRGVLREGLAVESGTKVGDVDGRGERSHCFAVSDKALAIAGGVLEAILTWPGIWG